MTREEIKLLKPGDYVIWLNGSRTPQKLSKIQDNKWYFGSYIIKQLYELQGNSVKQCNVRGIPFGYSGLKILKLYK